MSLYNEERPQKLSEVKGQENVVSQIRGILVSGNVPNCSLFVGPRGTGKTTAARIFARSLNCTHPTEDGPCNECESCKQILAEGSLDVVELDAASHNKVEDVHQIIESSSYAPLGKYKVYIIDEVHMLSISAFNALLKLLEEPPAHCKFILCTTEEHKVPVTIASRCRKFYFEKINLDVVAEKLSDICTRRNITFETDAIRMIARSSEGCMRDAESLLEIFLDAKKVDTESVAQILGTASEDTLFGLIQSVFSGDSLSINKFLSETVSRGRNLTLLTKSLIEALTDICYFLQSNGDVTAIDNSTSYKEAVRNTAPLLTVDHCIESINSLSEVLTSAQKSNDIEFILKSKLFSLMSYKAKVSELESELECLKDTLFGLVEGDVTITPPKTPETATLLTTSSNDEEVTSEEIPVSDETFDDDNYLPGDVLLPEGTDIKGKISLFPNTASTITVDEEPASNSEDDECPIPNTDTEVSIPKSVPVPDASSEEGFEQTDTTETPFADNSASKTTFTKKPLEESESSSFDGFDVFDIPLMKDLGSLLS